MALSLIEDIERCFAAGWTDGLPIVPPYGSLVDAMLAELGWKPLEIVGELKQLGVEVRAEHLAATAVMAGCKPSYGPLLRVLGEALLDPAFNLSGVEVTTGGASTLVIVSGPAVTRFGFEHETNALGASVRPNATVGRFASMVRQFCGRVGDILEPFGTIGHPGRLTFCIAEHPTTVWDPFHTQFEFGAGDSVVTVMATEGPNSVNNHYGMTARAILDTIADCIAHYGSTNYYWRRGGYLVVLPPEHMSLVQKEFKRDEARRYLYEKARRLTDDLISLGRLPSAPQAAAQVERGTLRSPVETEYQLTFIESGRGGGKFSAVIPGWVANQTVSRKMEG